MTSSLKYDYPFTFEGASLRHTLKDQVDFVNIEGSGENSVICQCKLSAPFRGLYVSLLVPAGYPHSSHMHVTVHRSTCKTNIKHALTTDSRWHHRLCEENHCCPDLLDVQRFLQNVAVHFSGTQAAFAVLALAKRHIVQLDEGTYILHGDFFENGTSGFDSKSHSHAQQCTGSNPLAFVKCTPEAFAEWHTNFTAEPHVNRFAGRGTRDLSKGTRSGRAFFELNMDTREVDWGLFDDSEASDGNLSDAALSADSE